MAQYKLWLADKPDRRDDKKEKNRRQGTELLAAQAGIEEFVLQPCVGLADAIKP